MSFLVQTGLLKISAFFLLLTLFSCSKYPEEIIDTFYWTYSFEYGKSIFTHSSLTADVEYKIEVPKRGKVKLFKNGEEIARIEKESFNYSVIGEGEILVDSIPFSSKNFKSHFVKQNCDCSKIDNVFGTYQGVRWSKNDFVGKDTNFVGTMSIEKVDSKFGCFITSNLYNGVVYVDQANSVADFAVTDDRWNIYADSVDFYFCSSCPYYRMMGLPSNNNISSGFNGVKVP